MDYFMSMVFIACSQHKMWFSPLVASKSTWWNLWPFFLNIDNEICGFMILLLHWASICFPKGRSEYQISDLQVCNFVHPWESWMPFHCHQSRCCWSYDWFTRMARYLLIVCQLIVIAKLLIVHVSEILLLVQKHVRKWFAHFLYNSLLHFRCGVHGCCCVWIDSKRTSGCWKAINLYDGFLTEKVCGINILNRIW